jgi:O-antigen ligase
MIKKGQNFFLYLYAFTIPFEYWDPFGLVGVFSVVKLIAIFYFIFSLFGISENYALNKIKKFVYPLFCLFGIMFIINIFNLFFLPISAPLFNVAFFQNIILFILLANHFGNNIKLIYNVLLSYTLGIILLGVLYSYEIGIVIRQQRISVFGDNPNSQGTKVAIGIFILIFFVLKDKLNLKYFRFLLLLPFPVLLDFMISSGSRGALMSLFLSLFLLIFLLKFKSLGLKICFIIIGMLASMYLYNKVMSNELINKRMEQFTEEGSLGGREDIWQDVFTMIESSPYIGIGESGFKYEMTKIYGHSKSAHNYFIYVFVTCGIVGLGIFLFFLFNIYKISFSSYKHFGEPIYIILFALVIFAMFRSGGTLGDKSYWFFLAMIVGASFELKNRHKITNNIINLSLK